MVFTVILAVLVGAAAPSGTDGISMTKRVVAAIRGEVQFQDSDFVHPLRTREKATLREFAGCRTDRIFYMLKPVPAERDTYVENPDDIFVIFACKGVPIGSPAAMSVHLKDGKISTIETHNADLLGKP